ncbi:MAG: trypsin-like peptidase domain-containing protein [Bryobacteraceae bacterium]
MGLSKVVLFMAVGLRLASAQAPRSPIDDFSEAIEKLIRQVNPAVLEVVTESYGGSESESGGNTSVVTRRKGLGTGVFVSADGDMLTNAHVVAGAKKVRVRMRGSARASGKLVDAEVAGVDRETDLALLKVPGSAWPHLTLADSSLLRQGQIVFAVGNPRGLENSITMGVVSSAARQISPDAAQVFIQTDAPINPGDSGGPLIDARGEIVGINTFIFTESGGSEGLGFAIPGNLVRDVYAQLKKYGRVRRGKLGVAIRSVTPTLATALGLSREDGVLIQDVAPGKAAANAGVQPDDIVIRVEGRPVRNVRQFENSLFRSQLGGTLTLELVRGREAIKLQVPFKEDVDPSERLAEQVRDKATPVPQLGILGITLDPSTAALVAEPRYHYGVIAVANLQTNVPFQEELQAGDIIYSVNGKLAADMDGLNKLVSAWREGDPLVVRVQRDDILRYLVLRGE